jgi:hypothetical protein
MITIANLGTKVGGFTILYDESLDPNPKKSVPKRNTIKIWK